MYRQRGDLDEVTCQVSNNDAVASVGSKSEPDGCNHRDVAEQSRRRGHRKTLLGEKKRPQNFRESRRNHDQEKPDAPLGGLVFLCRRETGSDESNQ